VTACLCGHFEFCAACNFHPPTVEERARIERMTCEDWSRSVRAFYYAGPAVHNFSIQMGESSARHADDIVVAVMRSGGAA
jgi:hypothetical protein